MNRLTFDMRGPEENAAKQATRWPDDLDEAFEFLVSQPGVNRDVVGIGGAGLIGVEYSVETARLHPARGEIAGLAFRRDTEALWEGLTSCVRRRNCQSCSLWPTMTNTLPS